jgi:outer membrane protein assembly factor BamB
VLGSATQDIDPAVNIAVFDSTGVVETVVPVEALGGNRYQARATIRSNLAPRQYVGQFEVRLCRDSADTCRDPLPGSPWILPYKITVASSDSRPALAVLPGSTGWTAYQGDPAHTGAVQASISAQAISRRWVVSGLSAGTVTAANGRVFLPPPPRSFGVLKALSEDSGAELWRYQDATISGSPTFAHGGAAIDGDRIWVRSKPLIEAQDWLLSLDARTGATLFKQAFGYASSQVHGTPVTIGAKVYYQDGYGVQVARRDGQSGAFEWSTTPDRALSTVSTNSWAPAVSGGRAYVFDRQTLWVLDATSGALLGSVAPAKPDPTVNIWDLDSSPVVGDSGRVYVSDYLALDGSPRVPRVVAYDAVGMRRLWSAPVGAISNPVLAAGAVLVQTSDRTLTALDPETGAVLWTWRGPTRHTNLRKDAPLLVVGTLAFVGLEDMTYAIDLNTHKAVWQYPASGRMAVSENGTLYIAQDTYPFDVIAFNLRQRPPGNEAPRP